MDKIKILSTGKLGSDLLQKALKRDIEIHEVPFIKTELLNDEATLQKIKDALGQKISVVFTSKNAVNAVAENIQAKPFWKIFCIGNATAGLVEKIFGKENIIATAADGIELAEKIIVSGEKKVVFFCGDIRRDELPEKLAGSRIEVREIVVYKTTLLPQLIDAKYDGILFFSPSAVESFFSVNTISETSLFAIGKTTAKEINKYSHLSVTVSNTSSKEEMIGEVINYFNKAKTN